MFNILLLHVPIVYVYRVWSIIKLHRGIYEQKSGKNFHFFDLLEIVYWPGVWLVGIGACRPGPTRTLPRLIYNAPCVVGFIKIRFHCCRKSNKVSSEGSFDYLAWTHNFSTGAYVCGIPQCHQNDLIGP